jgi:hypothetical protein
MTKGFTSGDAGLAQPGKHATTMSPWSSCEAAQWQWTLESAQSTEIHIFAGEHEQSPAISHWPRAWLKTSGVLDGMCCPSSALMRRHSSFQCHRISPRYLLQPRPPSASRLCRLQHCSSGFRPPLSVGFSIYLQAPSSLLKVRFIHLGS